MYTIKVQWNLTLGGIILFLSDKYIKNTFFFKLVLSFLAFSFLIVIVLSSIFSKISVDNAFHQVSSEYINSLKQGSNAIEKTFEEIGQVYTFLNTNEEIYEFMNTLKNDPYVDIKADNEIRKIKQVNSYISSIFVFNGVLDKLIFQGLQNIEKNSATEKELLTRINNEGNKFILPRIIEQQIAYKNEKIALITMQFHETFTEGKKVRNAVLINIDEDRMQKNLIESQGSTMMAVDKKGMVFLHSNYKLVSSNISKQLYFHDIVNNKRSSGSFVKKIEGVESTVSFYKNESLGWYFIGIHPYKNIAGSMDKKRNQVIVFSLIVLLVFSFTGYVLSKGLYSPIKRISNSVKDYNAENKNTTDEKNNNEFSIIMDAFRNSVNQIKSLELKNKESIFKLKEDFLRKLLKNENITEADEEEVKNYEIEISFENLIMVSVKIDSYNKIDSNKKELFEIAACTIIRKTMEEDFYSEVVKMYSGEFAILLNYKDNEINDFSMLLKRMEEVKEIILKTLEISITVGIGDAVDNVKKCWKAYENARNMVKYRFILGYNKVIYQRYIEDNLISSANYPEEIEEKLVRSMRLSKRAEFDENIDNIVQILKNYKYSDAALILLHIILACTRALNQIEGTNKKMRIDFDEFNRMFLDLQTIEQAKERIIKIYEEYQRISEDVNKIKGDKHYKVIEDIKRYIYENYNNTGLGAEMLADITGYTTNYFAKVFKEVTGIYIIDYIRQVRINKAKELLKKSSHKINEISDMVGFINTSYFYSAFKKEVGLTPASFRGLITVDSNE